MAGYSPGWNDPPPLSFQCNVPAGKRTLLNKRVPFPLNQSTHSPQLEKEKHDSSDFPSPILSSADATASSPVECKESSQELITNLTEEEILSTILNTFEKILSENSERYEKKRIEEINQRIKIMKDLWNSKISLQVKHKMLTLSQELAKGDSEAAMKIQCILMVDYLREVKQWMVGVKHIIEMERQKMPSSEVSSESCE